VTPCRLGVITQKNSSIVTYCISLSVNFKSDIAIVPVCTVHIAVNDISTYKRHISRIAYRLLLQRESCLIAYKTGGMDLK
jgi:hypothetical protein